MQLKIYKSSNYSENNNLLELECKGNGTKEDPFIINPSTNLPEYFEINESEDYILISNCSVSTLKISISKNITLKDCYVDWLEVSGCRNILITDVISGLLALVMSHKCTLYGCEIERELCISNSSNNLIKNCIVKQRLDYNLFERCSDNRFEDNIIPEKHLSKISKDSANLMNDSFEKQLFTIPESATTFECKGNGYKDDPFIFTPQVFYMNRFSLLETVHYVIIKNFNLRYIGLARCKNKFIEDSKIKLLLLDYCSNVKIERTEVKKLWIGQVQDVLISDCTVDKINVKKSFEGGIVFKNCAINQMKGKNLDKIKFES
ncbi:MAG: hypothetical protein ACFFA3_18525 [Promethearchaeota archaeon]